MSYYLDKIEILKKLFGSIEIKNDNININNQKFKIINDVIILNDLEIETDIKKLKTVKSFSFEWKMFNKIHKDNLNEFNDYFDQVNLIDIEDKIFADFGCGMGRWTKILNDQVSPKFNILIDYSDAIFEARKNLKNLKNCIFIKADLEKIDFKSKVIDFFICLGVLHHIPNGPEKSLQNISKSSKKGLCYLYYNFENRNGFFKFIFTLTNYLRIIISNIENKIVRTFLVHLLTIFLYYPFILSSRVFDKFGLNSSNIPLNYYVKSKYDRILQDCYDRFFTKVENRYSKKMIKHIFNKHFAEINISSKAPYWHFNINN